MVAVEVDIMGVEGLRLDLSPMDDDWTVFDMLGERGVFSEYRGFAMRTDFMGYYGGLCGLCMGGGMVGNVESAVLRAWDKWEMAFSVFFWEIHGT